MKYSLLFAFISFKILAQSSLNGYYQQQADYQMNIELDTKNYTYKGYQKLTYTNNSPDTLTKVYYHLYWNAFQPNSLMDYKLRESGTKGDQRMTTSEGISKISLLKPNETGYQKIQKLEQDKKPVIVNIQGTIAEVILDHPILPHSSTVFTMEWNSQIPNMIRRAGKNNSEGIALTMTQWYPKIAEYDYEGWHTFDYIGREFHGVFGNYDVKINLDKNYIVGAGAILQNPSEVKGYQPHAQPKVNNGKTLWHFKAENILDFAWGADPYYTVDSIKVPSGPLVYLVYKKTNKKQFWEEIKPFIPKYYDFMKNRFGAYPYPTYSFIQGGDGGMEYGMCTLILGNAKTLEDLAKLMFHEASHSWFQQVLATNESMRAWMDEGFTSYAEDLVFYNLFPDKRENVQLAFTGAIDTYTHFTEMGKEEPMGLLADHFKTNNGYTIASYVKGELFLVELGYIVGENTLSKIIKEYFRTWKFKHPTDRDFIHIAQKISGIDLKWFWNYMTMTTRQIDYEIKKVESKNEKNTKITLENSGDFPMPIDIYITYKNKKTEIYHIPLNLMRGYKKPETSLKQINLSPWNWTEKEYSFEIPTSLESIQFIIIDASKRLIDVNYSNNIYINQ